ncbi:MAG: hypothetical protein KIS92_03270 [Planctomycetota bacterium]|nr:hypothetical protein [Planctomycetota bacterium]
MQDIITRLRASKQENDMKKREGSRQDGRVWAEQDAEHAELEALAAAFSDPENRFEDNDHTAYSAGERFFFAICPDQDGDREAANCFWESQIPDAQHLADNAAWVNGFIDGALEVWEEVKDLV